MVKVEKLPNRNSKAQVISSMQNAVPLKKQSSINELSGDSDLSKNDQEESNNVQDNDHQSKPWFNIANYKSLENTNSLADSMNVIRFSDKPRIIRISDDNQLQNTEVLYDDNTIEINNNIEDVENSEKILNKVELASTTTSSHGQELFQKPFFLNTPTYYESDEVEETETETTRGQILDDSMEVESMQSIESESEYLSDQNEMMIRKAHMERLGSLPDIDEISIDISEIIEEPKEKELVKLEEVEEVEEEIERESEEAEEEEEPWPDFDDDEEVKQQMDDEFANIIAERENKLFRFSEIIKDSSIESDNKKVVEEFLESLIEKLMVQSDATTLIAEILSKLDKKKMLEQVLSLISEFDKEKSTMIYLNKKVTEYYRRKRIYLPILQDDADRIDQLKKEYVEKLEKLDGLLGSIKYRTKKIAQTTAELKAEIEELKSADEAQTIRFRALVTQTITSNTSFERLNTITKKLLNEMECKRKEISQVRFRLVNKQSILLALLDKLEQLQRVAPGLRLGDFDRLETESGGLLKKIEERNKEMIRLRKGLTTDIHLIAHIREYQSILNSTIHIQDESLNELIFDKQMLREYITTKKIEKGKIRREIEDVRFQGGLLDMPHLMRDYDMTVERINELKAITSKLKMQYNSINNKLKLLEKATKNLT